VFEELIEISEDIQTKRKMYGVALAAGFAKPEFDSLRGFYKQIQKVVMGGSATTESVS